MADLAAVEKSSDEKLERELYRRKSQLLQNALKRAMEMDKEQEKTQAANPHDGLSSA
jgi:hypothetical protein